MTSTECVGWEGERCWSFNPHVHRFCFCSLWATSGWTKKTNHTNSQKRDLYFCWTKIKAESREVFSCSCCSFCPAIHSSWKTQPLHDLLWSRTLPESGGGFAKEWKPVFSSFFVFFVDSESHPGALSQTLRSHLPGTTAGHEQRLKSCFLVTHSAYWDANRPLCGGSEQTRSRCPGQILPVSYPLTALTSFQCYLCFCFQQR